MFRSTPQPPFKGGAIGAAGLLLAAFLGVAAVARGEDAPRAEKPWESVGTIGFTLSEGNSQNYLLSALLNTSKQWKKNELLLGLGGGYGQNTTYPNTSSNVTTTTDNYLNGFAQWNYNFKPKWYAGLRLSGAHDVVADLQYRITLSPLLGYYFWQHTNTFMAAEIGPGFVTEEQGLKYHSYVALRLAQRFEYKFHSGAKVWDTISYAPQVDDFNNYIVNFEAGVSAPIAKNVDVRLILQDTFNNEPPPGRKQNDLKLIAGLGFRF